MVFSPLRIFSPHLRLDHAHIRATDFEMMCAPEEKSTDRKADFERNTREHFLHALTYAASLHLAYEQEKNHERSPATHLRACKLPGRTFVESVSNGWIRKLTLSL